MKRVVIIGAGPAGLTAAYELSKHKEYSIIVLEESNEIGGISKTVNYKGNRMDMGGHRFFSKSKKVNDWWEEILPLSEDADSSDNIMLERRRVSRILYEGAFYDYPVSLSAGTIKNMGFLTTMKVGFSYLHSMLRKLPEDNLENFYINRFGRKLYSMFFEYYTENLWGRHPREIDASWGAQRVKGLSITALLKDIFGKMFKKKNRKVETSLIEQFKYPKFGPGHMWETVAKKAENNGAEIVMGAKVVRVHQDSKIVEYEIDGKIASISADCVISSMPIKDLVAGMDDVPSEIDEIAKGLPYRDYITLGVLVEKLKIENTDKKKYQTEKNRVPDCWIYIQDSSVKLGRMQIYNNWSPYMVEKPHDYMWIGLEYFVNEGDELWNMSEAEFTKFCTKEMLKLGIISDADDIKDTHMEHVKKAYPAYFDTYDRFDKVRDYLDSYDWLYCVGRNGQHRYNNMDHSMMTAFETVDLIVSGKKGRENVWGVNTEKEYHEDEK